VDWIAAGTAPAGEGKALFETIQSRRGLELRGVEQRPDGLASL